MEQEPAKPSGDSFGLACCPLSPQRLVGPRSPFCHCHSLLWPNPDGDDGAVMVVVTFTEAVPGQAFSSVLCARGLIYFLRNISARKPQFTDAETEAWEA